MLYVTTLKELWNKSTEIDKKKYHQSIYNILSQLTKTTTHDFKSFNSFLQLIFKNNFHYIYIIMKNDIIIGMSTLLIEPKLIHDLNFVGHIEDVVIDQKCRGNGYGKYIINYIIDISKKMGCYKLLLDCNIKNINFYTNLGFKNSQYGMSHYF
jgi:glucosamine-phosphate N-acetyltransferase